MATALHRLKNSVSADVQMLEARLGCDWSRVTFERAAEIFETPDERLPNNAAPASGDLYRLREDEPGIQQW